MSTSISSPDNYLGKAECDAAIFLRKSNPRVAWIILSGNAEYRVERLAECTPDGPIFKSWIENYRAAALPMNFLLHCLSDFASSSSSFSSSSSSSSPSPSPSPSPSSFSSMPLNRLAQPHIEEALKRSEILWQFFTRSMNAFDVDPVDVPYAAAFSQTFFVEGVVTLLKAMDQSCLVVGETYKWELRAKRAVQIFENTREQKRFRAACYSPRPIHKPYDPSILDNGVDPEIQMRQRYL